MIKRLAAPVIALAAIMGAAAAAPDPAEPVVQAERAFAALAHERGIAAAFTATMDTERAIRLTPEPQRAADYWAGKPSRVGPPYLEWRPIWAGASHCGEGDFGFTTGPYSYGDKAYGYYFTIWGRREPNDPWKWLLDFGVERETDPKIPKDAPVVIAAPASGHWPSAHHDAYWSQVDKADKALNDTPTGKLMSAYALKLAPDARAMGVGMDDPAIGKAAVLRAVERRNGLGLVHKGSFVSQCGDLGFTYGTADWSSLGKLVNGDYVRVWRRAGPHWALLFEEVTTPG